MSAEVTDAGAPREERCRLAVLAASAPLLLLAAPAMLPVDGDGSILFEVRREPAFAAVVALVFGWPVLVGALGLRGALARRPPRTGAFALLAVPQALAASALLLLIAALMIDRTRTREEPGVWGMALAAAVVIYVVLRGFRRAGWHRWAQLVAGVWLAHASFAVALRLADPRMFAPPRLGGWLYVFALAAAAPAIGWALSPRRG